MARTQEKELVLKYQRNPDDYETINELIKKYEVVAKKLAYDQYHILKDLGGFTAEELYAVAISAVHIAAIKFGSNKEKEFYPYWRSIAMNQISTYVMKNSYKGWNREIGDTYYEGEILREDCDILRNEKTGDYVDSLTDEIILHNGKLFHLSKGQATVMKLFIRGYDLSEISKLIHSNKSTVYDRYYSAIEKIRKYYLKQK